VPVEPAEEPPLVSPVAPPCDPAAPPPVGPLEPLDPLVWASAAVMLTASAAAVRLIVKLRISFLLVLGYRDALLSSTRSQTYSKTRGVVPACADLLAACQPLWNCSDVLLGGDRVILQGRLQDRHRVLGVTGEPANRPVMTNRVMLQSSNRRGRPPGL
jgi:hypothetical protein